MGGLVTFGETMALLTSATVGPLRHATSLNLGTAGAESNVAIGVRRLGAPAAWMGRVGDDEFGRLVLAKLAGEQVDVAAATVDPGAPTGLMVKERRNADTLRVLYYRRWSAGSRLAPEHLDEARIGAARVLHVTGITAALSDSAHATVFSAVEVARAAGIPVSFDPNYRAALWSPDAASAVCQDLTAKADVIFATEEEAAMLVGPGSPEQLSAALAARGPGQVLIKLGAAGAVAQVDGPPRRVDPVTVPVVDTVGAGDGFAAGYLWGLITGREVDERLRVAALTGAFAVTVAGDWEGLPNLAELDLLAHPPGTVTR